MAKLKPWYQVVTPREDLRENRPLDASEFAVHLDDVRQGLGHIDYVKPERFFDRTFMTASLLDLASQVLRRLSGIQVETSAVFNMATQFGGGKTHSLTALYHLATNGDEAKGWKGVDGILNRAAVKQVPKASVAVLVGTKFDALSGRGGHGEPVRKTPWGEIVWQLGGEKSLAVVAAHDAKGIAPAGDVIRQMLPAGPVLILMDELLHYMSTGRKLGLGDQLYNFLRSLGDEACTRNNVAICVSVPSSSDVEMNPEDRHDYEAIKQMLDRQGKAILMSADKEMAEIIRRRLFEWGGMPDEGRKTASAYAEWAVEHAKELTGFDADTAYETFLSAYPFHPAVLRVFEQKWQSLPRFQRTRGVLRMLALWVSHAYQEEHRKASREPLITLGLAPLEDPTFRAAIFEQLGSSELEIPVTTDIVGKSDAHGVRLDKEATEAVRQAQLHRKVATTIFFESNGGMSQARADASVPEIKTGVCGPDMNMVDVDNVLEGLASSCFYLNWERNRYRFGLSPNLNQILVSRRGAVQDKEIDERIKQQTQKLFDKHSVEASKQIDRKYWPARSNDVPSRPLLTLVVLGLENAFGVRGTDELMEAVVRDCGTSGRTYKSALIFAAPDAGVNVRDAARNALAWEDIDDDEDTKKRVDEAQLKLLARNLANARRDLDETIFRAYRHVCLLGKDNKVRHVDLGQITSSSAGSLVELILRELERNDEITAGVSPGKLVKFWPPALVEWSTKAVRDAFFSSPQLPRLLNGDTVKRTICDGVSQGTLGYASKDSAGRLKLEKLKQSLIDADVEISDEMFILKADDAQKLLEPPRLAKVTLRPEQVVLKIGEQASFTCAAVDQYGEPFTVPAVTWSATGGTVTAEGLFTAGQTGGLHTVRAVAAGHEALAEVRITTKDEPPPPPPPPGEQVLRWRGTVPPQKWMNFYTKVLTRFASKPGLKVEVSFEVLIEREQADGKIQETRAGLKELGLNDDLSLT
jgi:hypothetical protein